MTYPITDSHLSGLRDELQTLNRTSSRLVEELRSFRQSHDAHLNEVAAERERRKWRWVNALLVVAVLVSAIKFILLFTQGK